MTPNPEKEAIKERLKKAVELQLESEEAKQERAEKSPQLSKAQEARADRKGLKRDVERGRVVEEKRTERAEFRRVNEQEMAEFQKGVDHLLTLPRPKLLKIVTGKTDAELEANVSFTTSFGNNKDIQRAIGLSMIMPSKVRSVSVNGVIGHRKGPNGNFYTDSGKYVAIFEGDRVRVQKVASTKEAKSLNQNRKKQIDLFVKDLKTKKVPEKARDQVFDVAANYNIDAALLLAIREVYQGKYQTDVAGNENAQLQVAAKYLQTAKIAFEKTGEKMTDKKGNYTPEFIEYLLTHYSLFGESSTVHNQKINDIAKQYYKYRGVRPIKRRRLARRVEPAAEKPASQMPPAKRHEVNHAALKGPDTTRGLKGRALLDNPQFRNRLIEIANEIEVPPRDLVRIMTLESNGIDPTARYPKGSASGLIQFIDTTAKGLGTTIHKIRKMSALEQLEYVRKFYLPYKGKIHNYQDLYLATFYPLALKKDMDFVFGSQESMAKAREIAGHNKGIAAYSDRPDKLIDKKCFYKYALSKHPKGYRAFYQDFDTRYA